MEEQELRLCCQGLFAVPAVPVFAPSGWERSQGSCIPRDKPGWMFFREDCCVFHCRQWDVYTVCKKTEFLAFDQREVRSLGRIWCPPLHRGCFLKLPQELRCRPGEHRRTVWTGRERLQICPRQVGAAGGVLGAAGGVLGTAGGVLGAAGAVCRSQSCRSPPAAALPPAMCSCPSSEQCPGCRSVAKFPGAGARKWGCLVQ